MSPSISGQNAEKKTEHRNGKLKTGRKDTITVPETEQTRALGETGKRLPLLPVVGGRGHPGKASPALTMRCTAIGGTGKMGVGTEDTPYRSQTTRIARVLTLADT